MALPDLFTSAELERRLSASVMVQLFDDDNVGTPNSQVVAQFITDASNKVRAFLGPCFDQAVVSEATAPEVRRIALDVAQAMGAQRHPEVIRTDGFKLMKQAEDELKGIRNGITNLGINDQPSSRGGSVVVSGTKRGW